MVESIELPSEGDTVFVTVGTALDLEDRAVVEGTATDVGSVMDGAFTLTHERVHREGSYTVEEDNPRIEAIERSGPYGPGLNEEFGDVWAYDRGELPV